jgi:hypothetical protein
VYPGNPAISSQLFLSMDTPPFQWISGFACKKACASLMVWAALKMTMGIRVGGFYCLTSTFGCNRAFEGKIFFSQCAGVPAVTCRPSSILILINIRILSLI